jgi:hypothetical protein
MKRLYWLTLSLFLSSFVFAQEGGADIKVDINKSGDSSAGFFGNPIVWVVGAAVFILLLVALLRGRRS